MSVYARYKRNPEGFRSLVELLESTPASRRQKMINVGMAEDADFTKRALQFMLSFEDVLNLPESELAEVLSDAPARTSGMAVALATAEIKERFVRAAPPPKKAEVRDTAEESIPP